MSDEKTKRVHIPTDAQVVREFIAEAELTFRNGTVKYVVVWIEKDAEVTSDV